MVAGMLNRVATDHALKLLGESKAKQNLYFICTFVIWLVPITLAGQTRIFLILALAAVIGFLAWLYWFSLVRSLMKHFDEQVP